MTADVPFGAGSGRPSLPFWRAVQYAALAVDRLVNARHSAYAVRSGTARDIPLTVDVRPHASAKLGLMEVRRAGPEDRDGVITRVVELGPTSWDRWMLEPADDPDDLWLRLIAWRVDLLLATGIILLDEQNVVAARRHPMTAAAVTLVRRTLRPAAKSLGGRLYPDLPDSVLARLYQLSRAVELILGPAPVLNLHFSGPPAQTVAHWRELTAIAAVEHRALTVVVGPDERVFAASFGFAHERSLPATRKRPAMEAWRR